MSLNHGGINLRKQNFADCVETGVPPLFVSLDENEPLPSGDYVRVVALSGSAGGGDAAPLQSGPSAPQRPCKVNGTQTLADAAKGPVVRHDFALHVRGARFCRLLESMLDAADQNVAASGRGARGNRTGQGDGDGGGALPNVVLPQATPQGCRALFAYLDMITSRVPSVLSKPLRVPLEELLQPWEMMFLLEHCMDEATTSAIFRRLSTEKENGADVNDQASYYSIILDGAPRSLNILLEVAMLSDFLLVEPLRQLTCAFIASLALSTSSEADLLRLCGLERALTEEELNPVYAQFPFLRPDESPE